MATKLSCFLAVALQCIDRFSSNLVPLRRNRS